MSQSEIDDFYLTRLSNTTSINDANLIWKFISNKTWLELYNENLLPKMPNGITWKIQGTKLKQFKGNSTRGLYYKDFTTNKLAYINVNQLPSDKYLYAYSEEL